MLKKQSSTSSKRKSRAGVKDNRKLKTLQLADGTVFTERYINEHPTKNIYGSKKDPEDRPEPKDTAAKHKYPPPKKDKVFREKWIRFIDGIVNREKFKVAHLETLEILCDLYVEYGELNKIIRTQGMTFEVVSRFGKTIKMRPEVTHLERVKSNIRAYTRQLDLFPKKDHVEESGGEADEWS